MPPLAGPYAASCPGLASCCYHPLLACMLFPAVLLREPLSSLCSPTSSTLRSASGVLPLCTRFSPFRHVLVRFLAGRPAQIQHSAPALAAPVCCRQSVNLTLMIGEIACTACSLPILRCQLSSCLSWSSSTLHWACWATGARASTSWTASSLLRALQSWASHVRPMSLAIRQSVLVMHGAA